MYCNWPRCRCVHTHTHIPLNPPKPSRCSHQWLFPSIAFCILKLARRRAQIKYSSETRIKRSHKAGWERPLIRLISGLRRGMDEIYTAVTFRRMIRAFVLGVLHICISQCHSAITLESCRSLACWKRGRSARWGIAGGHQQCFLITDKNV